MPAKISDVLRNHVKEKLARSEVVASMTVRLGRGIEIARIAKSAGFDSLYVDMEHSSFSLETMGQICMAGLEVGITPFVRVPGVADVQRILDAGALGIIAPHVSSAAEAREYVKAAKYPPLGDRSNAGNLPHLQYRSFPAAEAYAAVDAATMVIVQFESAAAIDNADAIMAVDGVDMVLIGTNDLLADYGLPGQYDLRGCTRLTPKRSLRAKSTASISPSAALPRAPTWRPNMCAWVRAMFRPAPIWAFCLRPVPPRRKKCRTWLHNDIPSQDLASQ